MPRMWIDLEELAVLLVRMVEVSVTHKGGIIVRRNMRITKSPLSRNQTGTYTVCPVERKPGREVVATVMREDDARLISAAPELSQALFFAEKALNATGDFMADKGLDTSELDEVVRIIGGLLSRIDGTEE